MKSERFLTIVMVALMTLNLAACGNESKAAADSQPTATIEPSAEPSAEPTVEPTVEPTITPSAEPSTEPTAEPTPEPSTAPTVEPTTAPTPAPNSQTQVDYTGDMTAWSYTPENADELESLLVDIDSVQQGAAGGSLQQANAAVCLMKLAMDESGKAVDAVSTYLSGMNDTQKDYFSFQWQQALKKANALLDGTEDAAILQDSGNSDFDLNTVDSAKVTALNVSVTDLLHNAGVTDEWKNHTDLAVFADANS